MPSANFRGSALEGPRRIEITARLPFGIPMAAPAQFSQIRILADDFARSWNFYKDGLGLTPVRGHGSRPYGEFPHRPSGDGRGVRPT